MRVVALEEHFLAPVIAQQIKGLPLPAEMAARLQDLGEGRIAGLDAAGIDFQVLGHTAPGLQSILGPEAASIAREANDYVAAAVRRFPTRLGAFAVLPTSDPRAAVDELRRSRQELGLLGAMINGTTAGRFLDHESFGPLLAAAEELKVPLYLHPGPPPPVVHEAYFRGFTPPVEFMLSTAGWGWHAETATHVLRMILGGVFDRHPRLQLIVGHMGEALPFMLARIDKIFSFAPTGLQRKISEYFQQNIHITTAGVFTLPPLLCSLMVLGAERILFSVDYPYSSNSEASEFLTTAAISDRDRELIAHRNADVLLGLSA